MKQGNGKSTTFSSSFHEEEH